MAHGPNPSHCLFLYDMHLLVYTLSATGYHDLTAAVAEQSNCAETEFAFWPAKAKIHPGPIRKSLLTTALALYLLVFTLLFPGFLRSAHTFALHMCACP